MKNKAKLSTDIILKEFWRNNDRFADLFNTVLFDGMQVLEANELEEMDTDVSGTVDVKGFNQSISRIRDVIKKTAYGMDFIICGVENQCKVHYAMPLRNMIYDALGYLKEFNEINQTFKNNNSKGRENKAEEFLSGMTKNDRFHPIITIVIYYGEKEWDGPYSLADMMFDLPANVKNIFSNYKMNLLQVRSSDKYNFSNKDVETVFEISRNIFNENYDDISNSYKDKDINAELGMIIGKITDSNFIIEQSSHGRELVNMCTALEKLKNQGVEEGLREGLREGLKEAKIKTARKSLEQGLEVELISKITDLSIDEIQKIKQLMISEGDNL